MLAWSSVWSEVHLICIWSSGIHCHHGICCFIKIQVVLSSIVPVCRVVLVRRPLKGCLCYMSSTVFLYSVTQQTLKATRHRASTSMYSLTFCVCSLLPECHQWKPAFQTAAVMLRTPPVVSRSPAGRPRPLPVCGVQFWGRPPSPAGRRRA